MNDALQRPSWRLHALTIGAGVAVAAACAALNLLERSPASLKALEAGWPFSDELPLDWYRLTRQSVGHVPVDLEPLPQRPKLVASNLAVAIVLVMGSIFAIERRLRLSELKVRFGIKAILVATACAASFLAIARIRERLWNLALTAAAVGAVAIATVLTWLVVLDVVGLAWNRLEARRSLVKAANPQSHPQLPSTTQAVDRFEDGSNAVQ